MFSNGVVVTGGTFIQENRTDVGYRGGLSSLKEAVASSAFHDSGERFDPPKCHPNTRVAVIQHIMDWITGKIDTDTLILWLYGPAGAGKSAIAQTIAELCHKEGLLLATFFFSRTDPTRNNVQRLVATLVYKAILSIPATRALVEQIVEGDPLIFKTSLETQFKKLIIEPLIYLFQSGVFQQFRFPPLVILDGLDECVDRDSQRILLEALSHSSRQHQLPLKFLIASRPEQIINASFKSSALKTLTYRLPLNNDFNPDDDIRTYLLSEFEEIRNTHPVGSSIPSSWPSDEDIDRLVSKSSGQFIYGSLVIRFTSSLRHDPRDRLRIVLGLKPPRRDLPFMELDALYTQILSSVEDVDTVLKILGTSIALSEHTGTIAEPLALPRIEKVLDLEDGCSIELTLGDLSSLVEYDASLCHIRFHHASFTDFLLDKQRSRNLHIDTSLVYSDIVRWALRAHNDPDINVVEIHHISVHFGTYCQRAAPTPELRQDLWDLSLPDWTSSMTTLDKTLHYMSTTFGISPPTGPFSFAYLFLAGAGQIPFADTRALHVHHHDLLNQYLVSLTQGQILPDALSLLLLLGVGRLSPSSEWRRTGQPRRSTQPYFARFIYGPICMGVSDTFQEALISIFQLSPADLLWEENTINLLKFRCSEMWDVDTDVFEMHRFPTGYENFLLDFFADPGRPEELRLSSDRYTTLALGCLKYLCRPSRRRADPRCRPFTQWAQKSRNAPWVWRRLRQNPRLLPWVRKQWRYWRRFGVRKSAIWWDGLEVNGTGERLLNELDDSRWSEARECRAIAADERSLPLRTFALALHLLPQLLDQASQSEGLVDAVSRGVFHPTSIFFFHRTRRAKDAVRKYVDRSNTYISADM